MKMGVLNIGDAVAAFSEDQVERLTGLSKGRLRYWAKTDFFSPSYVESNPRLAYSRFYSFKDVVALRTLERLRVQNGVPLQHLRKVAERLAHLEDRLWTATTLYVANRSVAVVNSETGDAEEVVSGQFVMPILLKDVIDDTRAEVVRFRRRDEDSIGKVNRSRSIARNAWVIDGTRIPIESIKRLNEDGYSVDEIIGEYPDLTEADVEAALAHEDPRAA